MPITVEKTMSKAEKSSLSSDTDKKKAVKPIPKWIWWVAIAGVIYAAYSHYTKKGEGGEISSQNSV